MAPLRKYRILVVDDEPSVLTTYRMILEQKGYEVLPATSSKEARRALDSEKLDLLLCDLSLEKQDSGFAVIEYARQCRPGLPSLLLTGYASNDVSERAQRDGISVLFKPIDIEEFLETISAHLRKAHEQSKASGR
jgi:DNA-binding NtrC family response regulator